VLFNEPKLLKWLPTTSKHQYRFRFSALQRAEIAEIELRDVVVELVIRVSVLFNEPKLLKFQTDTPSVGMRIKFQCSSTSRNC